MNPHYGDYYQDENGKTPPADYLSPNPIFFLTIMNVIFQFPFAIKRRENNIIGDRIQIDPATNQETKHPSKFSGLKPIAVVGTYLPQALKEHGIGAKTAVGYGRMEPPESTITTQSRT